MPIQRTIYKDLNGNYTTHFDGKEHTVTPFSIIGDNEQDWTFKDELGNKYSIPKTNSDLLTDLGGSPSLDKTEESKDYWHPIKGASARWQSSWNNGTNPVKGLLHSGILYGTPYAGAQMGYDLFHSGFSLIDNIQKYNYLNAMGDASNLGLSLFGLKLIPKNIRFSFYNSISPMGYSELPKAFKRVGDTIELMNLTQSRSDLIKNFISESLNPYREINLSPSYKPNWYKFSKQMLDEAKSEGFTALKVGTTNFETALDFRNDAERLAMKLPERENTIYLDNGDGTFSYNMKEVIKQREANGDYTLRPKDNEYIYKDSSGNLNISYVPTSSTLYVQNQSAPVLYVYSNGKQKLMTSQPISETVLKSFPDIKYQGAYDAITNNAGGVSLLKENGNTYMTDIWDVLPFSDSRTIWKWGSEHIPGLKNFEVIKTIGGNPFKLKHKL